MSFLDVFALFPRLIVGYLALKGKVASRLTVIPQYEASPSSFRGAQKRQSGSVHHTSLALA
jgi:hypothetical protein